MTPTFEWPILNPSPDQLSLIVGVLVGLALLFCGRRLYWLFVATIGFIITSVLAHALLPIPEDNAWWLALPILVGIIGAFLSVFLQKFFIRLGGLLTGAYLGYFLSAPLLEEPWPWVVLGASAVLGFFLVMQLKSTAMMLGVAVITGSGTYWFHNQARETLQRENQQLTATNQILVQAQQDLQGKAASLRQENDRLQKNLVDLHRLRNEATQARQLAEKLRQMEDLNRRLLAGMDEASTDARNAPQVDTSTMMIEPGVGLGPIQLGMAAEEVKQILGEPDVQIGTALQYMQLGMAILPRRKDGKVGAIMIGDSEGGSLAEAFKGSTREGIAMGAERDAIVGAFGEPTPRQRPDAQMDPRMLEAFLGDSGLRPEDLDLKKLEARSGIERLEYPDTGMTFLLRDGKLVHITME